MVCDCLHTVEFTSASTSEQGTSWDQNCLAAVKLQNHCQDPTSHKQLNFILDWYNGVLYVLPANTGLWLNDFVDL